MNLFDKNQLPENFEYPLNFLTFIGENHMDLEPWVIMEGDYLKKRYEGIIKRYHKKNLIPFARRIDNDDIACWDSNHLNMVVIIHDFASAGWEQRQIYNNFDEWMQSVKNDIQNYNS